MVRVILTSDEANEAFERAFLQARHEVWATFSHFDPDLALVSPLGQRVGATWREMIAATLSRGVRLHITLSEADAFAEPARHRAHHAAVRVLRAEAEAIGAADRLEIAVLSHPARERRWTTRAAWPLRRAKVTAELRRLAGEDADQRARDLADMPGLAPYLSGAEHGAPALRRFARPPLAAAHHGHQMVVTDRHMLLMGGPDITPGAGHYGLRIVRDGHSAADAQAHLEHFAEITAGRADPGAHRHLLRTLSCPAGRFRSTPAFNIKRDIATAHEALARRAEDLIYIETRAFTDPALAEAVAAAGRARPDLGLIVLLPKDCDPDQAAQRQVLAVLARAFGNRFFAGQMTLPLSTGGQRLALFDKRAALVTSADLTPAALNRDTEAGLYVRTPREVVEIGSRTMAFWLSLHRTAATLTGPETVSLWRARSEQGQARVRPFPIG